MLRTYIISIQWTGDNERSYEPSHDNTYNKTCATSEDSDQPVHPGYPKRDKREPLPYWGMFRLSLCWSHRSYCRFCRVLAHIEGWAQDCGKSDGCFPPNLIQWKCYEDYNISFCKQWKFRCHCSYEQWHLNLHCLQRGRLPLNKGFKNMSELYYSLALNPRYAMKHCTVIR